MCTEDPDSSATKQLIGKDLPCKDTPHLGRVATALGGKLVLAAALTRPRRATVRDNHRAPYH